MATNQDDNNKADPYKLLNVERDATPKQIRKAYYALSRLVHPDRNTAPDAVESFQALNKAWGILSDPDKRKLFDKTGCTDQDSEAFWNAYQQYRTVYPEVTAEDVEAFAKSYRNSDEEKTDLRDYYNQKKGDISLIMATIMCSETTDADRFVAFYESEISQGTLQRTEIYDQTRNTCGDIDLDHIDDMEEDEEEEEEEEEGEDDEMNDFIVPDNKMKMIEEAEAEMEEEEEEEVKEVKQVKQPKKTKAKRGRSKAATKNTRKIKKQKKSNSSSSSSSSSSGESDFDALRRMMKFNSRSRHDKMIDQLSSKYG